MVVEHGLGVPGQLLPTRCAQDPPKEHGGLGRGTQHVSPGQGVGCLSRSHTPPRSPSTPPRPHGLQKEGETGLLNSPLGLLFFTPTLWAPG